MLPSPFTGYDLFTLRAQLEAVYSLMRASSYQRLEARALLHVVFERLDALEQQVTRLRSQFQEHDA
jgi:hypothetical protein